MQRAMWIVMLLLAIVVGIFTFTSRTWTNISLVTALVGR